MEEKIGYREIFRQKEYMKTIIAAVINRLGDSIDSIAFVWLVYQVTQSAAWSAVIFGVNRIPTVFLQPFAGAAMEGRNKKRIMIITDILRGLCVGIVATAFLLGFLNQWILLVATVIISSAEAFRDPASASLIPKLLDKKYYTFGLSLNSSACSVSELVGLGAAGVLISLFSISTAIYIDMATFFISALIIMTLRVKEELTKDKINAKEYIENLKGGFLYLKDKELLRNLLFLGVFLNAILVPLNSLQAPMVSEVLHSGEVMLSVQSISVSAGMIIGAAAYPYLSRLLSYHRIISIGGYSIAFFYLSLVTAGRFITSTLLLYFIISVVSLWFGAAIAMLNSFSQVERTKNIESAFMARVVAIMSAACVAAMPVASFLIGAFAKFTPTIILFFAAGILDILVCMILCTKKRFPAGNAAAMENAAIEENVTIEENAAIEEKLIVEENVTVEENTIAEENATVEEKVTVEENVTVKENIIVEENVNEEEIADNFAG